MRHFRNVLVTVLVPTLCAAVLGGMQPASAQSVTGTVPGRIASGSLGASVRDVTDEDAAAAKVPQGKGAYVVSVREDGPAAKAGIKAGDVILDFDGQAVRSAAMLVRLVSETPTGRAVKATIVREGKRQDVTVTVEPGDRSFRFDVPDLPSFEGRQFTLRPPILVWPPDEGQQAPPGQWPRYNAPTPRFAPPLWQYQNGPQLGVSVQELTPQLREYFGVRQGVLVSAVTTDSAAARAGVKAGDVITMLDKSVVRTADDLRRLLGERQTGDRVALSIVRDKKAMTVTVTLEAPRTRIVPI